MLVQMPRNGSTTQFRLISVRRGLLSKSSVDIRTKIGLPIVRRHFHTDRAALPEAEAIMKVETNFELMRRLLGVGESFFEYPDEGTAAESTRGFFGSEFVVPAYTYTRCVVAITPQFLAIGPMCRAAVIVHQMAHFIDPGVRDQTGVFGPRYDSLNFEQALFNVHSYANFAVNSLPPYLDERFGVARLDV